MKTNILDKIRDYKINEVKERKINFPQNDIIDLIKDDKKTLGFQDKLIEKNDKGFPGIIAEVKRQALQKGLLNKISIILILLKIMKLEMQHVYLY